jgi:hypothetical protein
MMIDRNALLWSAWRSLFHWHRTANGRTDVAVYPEEVLHGWHLCRTSDELLLDRFAWCVSTAFPLGQSCDPQGFNIDIRTNRGTVEMWAGWDEQRPFDHRPADIKGDDLVALLRELLETDDAPSPPVRGAVPEAPACPTCHGRKTIGPVHVNMGRQPHRWLTVPYPACQGDAAEPVGRTVQAALEQFEAEAARREKAATPPAAAPPSPPAPTQAASPAQMRLFGP